MVKDKTMSNLLLLGLIAGGAYLLYKSGVFNAESSFWGGGSAEGVGATSQIIPAIIPQTYTEPLPQPMKTTVQAYTLLPEENRLQSGGFQFAPTTQSGNLTVFPIVTQSLVQQGVTQKYVPITQLGLPQTQMLMTLSQKLTPSVTYNTGAGVRLPAPSLYTTLNPVTTTKIISSTTTTPKTTTTQILAPAQNIIQKTTGISVPKLMTSITNLMRR